MASRPSGSRGISQRGRLEQGQLDRDPHPRQPGTRPVPQLPLIGPSAEHYDPLVRRARDASIHPETTLPCSTAQPLESLRGAARALEQARLDFSHRYAAYGGAEWLRTTRNIKELLTEPPTKHDARMLGLQKQPEKRWSSQAASGIASTLEKQAVADSLPQNRQAQYPESPLVLVGSGGGGERSRGRAKHGPVPMPRSCSRRKHPKNQSLLQIARHKLFPLAVQYMKTVKTAKAAEKSGVVGGSGSEHLQHGRRPPSMTKQDKMCQQSSLRREPVAASLEKGKKEERLRPQPWRILKWSRGMGERK